MRNSTKLQIGILTAIAALLLIIVPVTGVFNNREGDRKAQQATSTYNLSNPNFFDSFNGLYMYSSVTFIDPPSFTYKIHVRIEPKGNFVSSDGLDRLLKPVTLFVNGKPSVLLAGQPVAPQDITLTFADGDPNKYPFEFYSDVLQFYAQTDLNSTNP